MLNAALIYGHEHIVRLLISRGADPYLGIKTFRCAMAAAMAGFQEDCVKFLLEQPDILDRCEKIQYWPLVDASWGGRRSIAKLLLRHGADVNATCKRTALYGAAARGNVTLLKLLLEKGANVNVRCGLAGNAEQAVAANRQTNAVGLLLEHGANVEISDVEWEILLHDNDSSWVLERVGLGETNLLTNMLKSMGRRP